MKRILKTVGFSLTTFISLIIIYLIAAYCLSRIPVNEHSQDQGNTDIFILTNGVHTDLVLPARNSAIDWTLLVKPQDTRGKDTTARYVAFGWGDKGFYLDTPTWSDLTVSVACQAAFGLGNSAMHVTFYTTLKEGASCRRIRISQEHYTQLIHYVRASFQKDASGAFELIHTTANYGPNDSFYEAVGKYSLFHTCNTWANNGLKSCKQKSALWTPFDTGIFYHYSNQ